MASYCTTPASLNTYHAICEVHGGGRRKTRTAESRAGRLAEGGPTGSLPAFLMQEADTLAAHGLVPLPRFEARKAAQNECEHH